MHNSIKFQRQMKSFSYLKHTKLPIEVRFRHQEDQRNTKSVTNRNTYLLFLNIPPCYPTDSTIKQKHSFWVSISVIKMQTFFNKYRLLHPEPNQTNTHHRSQNQNQKQNHAHIQSTQNAQPQLLKQDGAPIGDVGRSIFHCCLNTFFGLLSTVVGF